MAASAKQDTSKHYRSLLLALVPLFSAVVFIWFFGAWLAPEIENLGERDSVISTYTNRMVLLIIIATAFSVFLIIRELRKLYSHKEIPTVLKYIVGGDFDNALDKSKGLGVVGVEIQQDIVSIQKKHTLQQETIQQQKQSLHDLLEQLNQFLPNIEQRQNLTEELHGLAVSTTDQTRETSQQLEQLNQNAEDSSSAILEMVTTTGELAENLSQVEDGVLETAIAIEEMTYSIEEVAKKVSELNATTAETAVSINEMDMSISQVEGNANETLGLAETVANDAETGVQALELTAQGIEKIKTSSETAAAVIERLDERIKDISNILNVINDVAEQTNLLSLNAAIIAAQAGESGRGFAVVADEIKELANRTGASTKEIAELIRTIQNESGNAIGVMSSGLQDVEECIKLGKEASRILDDIVTSAHKSTTMNQAIALSTVEQSKGSRQVNASTDKIAEAVQQIARATNEQAKGSQQIVKSAEMMKTMLRHLKKSSYEQRKSGESAALTAEDIRATTSRLSEALKSQFENTHSLASKIEGFKESFANTAQKTIKLREVENNIRNRPHNDEG